VSQPFFRNEALDISLQQLAWIDLPLKSMPDAVLTIANQLPGLASPLAQLLASGTTIQQVYQQADHELLILGEPGVGKSTLLYQLGRDLLAQAQQQPNQPLPIIFSLSSMTLANVRSSNESAAPIASSTALCSTISPIKNQARPTPRLIPSQRKCRAPQLKIDSHFHIVLM
jgi:DNA polymerase III delta prime subunit